MLRCLSKEVLHPNNPIQTAYLAMKLFYFWWVAEGYLPVELHIRKS